MLSYEYLARQVPVLEGVRPDQIPFDSSSQPMARNFARSGFRLEPSSSRQMSPDSAMDILQSHSSGKPVGVYIAPPEAMHGFSITTIALALIIKASTRNSVIYLPKFARARTNPDHSYYYMNSLTLDNCFPGLAGAQ